MHVLRSSAFFENPAPAAALLGLDVRSVKVQAGLRVCHVSSRNMSDVMASAELENWIHCSYLFRGPVDVSFARQRVRLNAGTLLTSHAPGHRFQIHLPQNHRNVELLVTPETLSRLAGDSGDRFMDAIRQGVCVPGTGGGRARDAAVRLAWLMNDDLAPTLLIHAAALEFLAWHLDAYQPGSGDVTVTGHERRLLMAARERLLQDLSDPPTIAELARETGLNQLKLKRGFKALFGHSIYALFQHARMDRARELLHGHGVTETAMMLGYSNVSHFSAAFRKQFGVLPRDVRRGALE